MSVDLTWWTNVPSILEQPDDILRRYIVEPQLPIFEPQLHVLPRTPRIENLYHVPLGAASTTLVPRRDALTNKIIDYVEEEIVDADSTATNSMSLRRAPGPPETATKGSTVNYPFWPGGFDEPLEDIGELIDASIDFEKDLLVEPPGFPYGIDFRDGGFNRHNVDDLKDQGTVDLLSFVDEENRILGLWREQERLEKEEAPSRIGEAPEESEMYSPVIGVDDDELLDTPYGEQSSVLKISDTIIAKSMEWAEMLDVTQPVVDFDLRIPNPAYKYPFELDIFQKQAIMKLEEHSHVFVAAHTSAGKTVVAEYAIALSKQHMTRTIYTSPIKALSNQKYHDFKEQFKDVGLITGDIQIDPTASCLIMTTEILRSMLYCGSEVTRDLEYVIFDEVHYITDPDRGYVWEEVLILLPDHVSIVMLSATVPNTLEFANWVGQTKKRKVFVCSTLKRPIPLMHYLYTGSGGKSKNDIFLLVNGLSEFSIKGHRDAIAAKEKDKPTAFKSHGMNPKQEQNMWIGMIDHLKRNDKLPVVCFTLSRNRCDRNLQALQSVDLCTAKEAGYNYYFVQKCVQQLKPEDRALPQVLTLQDSLRRGIGVHHSGILPILKEIVEILFQKGHVKLLFATETFAMGVNMPARTVIFDNLRKFDGVESRMLRPAEYTQMAGRAGRRGKDATGTVIMLCKGDVPAETDLRTMILGKPMRLESQFRLTYAMILNLLRVESVSVEDMMSHSFMEFGSRTRLPEQKLKLKGVEEQILGMQELGEHMRPLSRFYDVAEEYARLKEAYMTDFIGQGQIGKELKPGRILIVNQGRHYNKIALLLSLNTSKEIAFSVLVLDDQLEPNTSESSFSANNNAIRPLTDRGDLWHKMLSLTAQHRHYLPEGIGGHTVLIVKARDIVEVTKTTIKAETDVILQNWQQRQIPRFRDSPPGPTVVKVVNELYNLNNDVINGRQKLAVFDVKKDLDMQAKQAQLVKVRKTLSDCMGCTSASNFELEFGLVFDRKKLEQHRDQLQYNMSKESFALYPDYMRKLAVLRELQYIDDQHEVTMKGRVACEMGSNELVITELVLCNTFTDLEPDEIPALLSSLVFQAKTDVAPVLTPNLEKCIAAIKQVNESITNVEARHNVTSTDVTMAKDRLNFGLVEVVYEWARNKSFAEIIQLTDIQEGIIVRCIQQLNETIQDVKDAARIIGNPVLHKKMEDASNAIQRNIVFTASLYFQN